MPTHLQHDLYLQSMSNIAQTIAITLQVGPVQEPHWRAIHRFLRTPPDPPLVHCPDLTPQQDSLPPTLRATLMIKPIPPDSELDHAATDCYLAWLDAKSSPQYEDAHRRAKKAFWELVNSLADQYIGTDHHYIDNSQSLARFIAGISSPGTEA